MQVPQKLTPADMALLGIAITGDRMDNGEYRFRLIKDGPDAGYGYIMTVMPNDQCGWQNSHHHEGIVETYTVQDGWIGFAELVPGTRTTCTWRRAR
jgi:hypothetical protein